MPEYTSAVELLMDAELRADGLGPSLGVLVVEGPDDKRVFARHVGDPVQVLPAGGRKLLISAHEKANSEQRQKIVFVTDCDYEVRRGALRGAPDLVITSLTDMESDLLSLGLIEELVLDLVPRALESRAACASIAKRVRDNAEKIALPIGRIRMAAQPLGIALELGELKISRYWDAGKQSMDFSRLVDAMHSKVSPVVGFREWRQLVQESPQDSGMCHGKDLVRAIAHVLKVEYRVESATPDVLVKMMRSSLNGQHLDSWEVIRRIKAWQERHRRLVLSS